MVIPLLPKTAQTRNVFFYDYIISFWKKTLDDTYASLDGSGKVVWPQLQSPPQKSDGINLFQ
jgi:hypothetical protein